MASLRRRFAEFRAQARLSRTGASFPPVAPTGGGRERVFIGTAGSAGQNYWWGRSLEAERPRTAVVSSRLHGARDKFSYPVDQLVPAEYAAQSLKWQRLQCEALCSYRAAVIESGSPPFGRVRGLETESQVQQLTSAGVQCALLFHGSDIRDPFGQISLEPRSHYDLSPEYKAKMATVAARNRELIARTGLPVFVSTLALLSEVDDATWLPVVVDVEAWKSEAPPCTHDGPLRVAHAPSNSVIKGTELIEPELTALHEAGEIEYERISGVPHSRMPALYRSVDVVLDSFRTGNYGVAACEAMAAGRVCVAYISDSVRNRAAETTGQDLPIVQAVPETLAEVLRSLSAERFKAREIAARGFHFVQNWHDGSKSGKILADWLRVRDEGARN